VSTGWPHGMMQVEFYEDPLEPPLRVGTYACEDGRRHVAQVRNATGLVVADAYAPGLAEAEAGADWLLDICNLRLP
jgi:hypothetical protein